jgi:hypothetical protein
VNAKSSYLPKNDNRAHAGAVVSGTLLLTTAYLAVNANRRGPEQAPEPKQLNQRQLGFLQNFEIACD